MGREIGKHTHTHTHRVKTEENKYQTKKFYVAAMPPQNIILNGKLAKFFKMLQINIRKSGLTRD